MGMASDKHASPYTPSYRQQDVDETLQDHENRITRNERWLLILKGVAAGLAMATASEQGFGVLISLL